MCVCVPEQFVRGRLDVCVIGICPSLSLKNGPTSVGGEIECEMGEWRSFDGWMDDRDSEEEREQAQEFGGWLQDQKQLEPT